MTGAERMRRYRERKRETEAQQFTDSPPWYLGPEIAERLARLAGDYVGEHSRLTRELADHPNLLRAVSGWRAGRTASANTVDDVLTELGLTELERLTEWQVPRQLHRWTRPKRHVMQEVRLISDFPDLEYDPDALYAGPRYNVTHSVRTHC